MSLPQTGELDLPKFIKYFVASAEKVKDKHGSGIILDIAGAAFRSIPFVGAIIEKLIVYGGRKVAESNRESADRMFGVVIEEKLTEGFNNADKFRIIMIRAAMEIYDLFEYQLNHVYFNCEGRTSNRVAVQLLAEFAGRRCVQKLMDSKSAENLHKHLLKGNFLSEINLFSMAIDLTYRIEPSDVKGKPIFEMETTNYSFFNTFLPCYSPLDDDVVKLLPSKTKNDNLSPSDYVFISSSAKLPHNQSHIVYYLRPYASYELKDKNLKNAKTIEITSGSPRSIKQLLGHELRHRENPSGLIVGLLESLHYDENYKPELATMFMVKDLRERANSLDFLAKKPAPGRFHRRPGGINKELKEDAVTTIWTRNQIMGIFQRFEEEQENVMSVEGFLASEKLVELFHDVKQIINGGGGDGGAEVTHEEASQIMKALKGKLNIPTSINGNGVSQYNLEDPGSVLILDNLHHGNHIHNLNYNRNYYYDDRDVIEVDNDSNNFHRFFAHVLNHRVTLCQNVNVCEVERIVEKFKSSCNSRNSSYCVVIVLQAQSSTSSLVSARSFDKLPLNDNDTKPFNFYTHIFNKFNHVNFPSFVSKPKLFFVSGLNTDFNHSSIPLHHQPQSQLQPLFLNQSGLIQDYFIGRASFPNSVFYRDPEGSVYAQALSAAFGRFWKSTDLVTIHKYVSSGITELTKDLERGIQQPWQCNELRFPFYFQESLFN